MRPLPHLAIFSIVFLTAAVVNVHILFVSDVNITAMDDNVAPLKVFLPSTCLVAPFGYLLGTYNRNRSVCNITALVHSTPVQLHQRGHHLVGNGDSHSQIAIIGVWTDDRKKHCSKIFDDVVIWVELVASDNGDLPGCCVTQKGQREPRQQPVMVIIYDVQETLSSYYLKVRFRLSLPIQ